GRAALPGTGGAAELKRLVGKRVARPFDPRRPWWEFHLVERYDGGSALVARIHHSYADGIALIGVMLSLTDPAADAPPEAAEASEAAAATGAANAGILAPLFEPVAGAASGALRRSGEAPEK